MKTLKDTFSAYNLTNGQKELVESLGNFLETDDQCFILKGYAGTGKTFLMKGLCDYFTTAKQQFRIAAPTGRAAKVISQKTKHKAYTIHKTIYSSQDVREYKQKNIDGSETFKFFYALKSNSDQKNAIYIIDEASMISDKYAEAEFFRFGSGYLLRDLISYVNLSDTNQNRKIILIGDDAQLPPVNMNFSPALDADYLLTKCNLPSVEMELTEVVRQKKDSGILHNATMLRESLKQKKLNKLMLKLDFNDTHDLLGDNLLSKYIETCKHKIDADTILIAYSNAQVKEYNDLIREHFFPGKKHILPGDTFIIVRNNYNYLIELLNGDFGTVIQANDEIETRSVILKNKNKEGLVSEKHILLKFRDIVFSIKDIDENVVVLNCKIFENLLNSSERDISSDEQKAIYIDFWIRNPKLDEIRTLLHAKNINFPKLVAVVQNLGINDVPSKTFRQIKDLVNDYFEVSNTKGIQDISINILKDALRADPYFNALQIKYGYAITCHKAQGGEWKNVFLNCKTSMGYFNSSYFRWLYTGLTRASEQMFTINPPSFDVAASLIPPKTVNFSLSSNTIILSTELADVPVPFVVLDDKPFLKYIYLAVYDATKDMHIEFELIKSTDFLEHYLFTSGLEKTIIKIHYKKDGIISAIEKPHEEFEWSMNLFQNLKYFIGKKISILEVIDEAKHEMHNQPNFEFAIPHLEDFFKTISEKIKPSGIRITDIKHHKYHEIYEFSRDGLTAVYKFWYGDNNRFKKTEIISSDTIDFSDEINGILM